MFFSLVAGSHSADVITHETHIHADEESIDDYFKSSEDPRRLTPGIETRNIRIFGNHAISGLVSFLWGDWDENKNETL